MVSCVSAVDFVISVRTIDSTSTVGFSTIVSVNSENLSATTETLDNNGSVFGFFLTVELDYANRCVLPMYLVGI